MTPAPKLGKNAQRILAKLQERAGRTYTAESGLERGRGGGKFRTYGRQDWAGAQALLDAGLAEEVSRDHSLFYQRGYASHGSSLTIRLRAPA